MLKLGSYFPISACGVSGLALTGILVAGSLCGCGSFHSNSSGGIGTIETVVGDGHFGYSGNDGPATSARLKNPVCVVLDKSGNLYISDFWTNTVRKMDAATGILSIYAGNSIQGYSGDGGPASEASMNAPGACALDSGGNLYIADSGNNVIRKVAASTGTISTVAGNGYGAGFPGLLAYGGDGGLATKAELRAPNGIAIDSAGDIFISDELNERVREVNASTGIITTIAGTGTFGYSGTSGPATQMMIGGPEGLALDGSGNLYITETGAQAIAKLNLATGILSIAAGTGDSGSGALMGDGGLATKAQFETPTGIAIDPAGNLYISDTLNERVRKVTISTGIITSVAGTTSGYSGDGGAAVNARLNIPLGLAFDSAGNLYIADNNNYVVRKVTY